MFFPQEKTGNILIIFFVLCCRGRYGHELCLWERRLFVLGGGGGPRAEPVVYGFEDLPTFDIEEKRWFYTRTKADQNATMYNVGDDNDDDLNSDNNCCQGGDGYPEARRFHRSVQIGKHVWVFGGYDGYHVFGDTWQLDMSAMQWARFKMKLTLPVYLHAMTVTDEGKMVMFGGETRHKTTTGRVFSAWLTVPSLRSMAWEAVCHYQPNIATFPHTTLLEIGVPKECVKMLGSNTTSLVA